MNKNLNWERMVKIIDLDMPNIEMLSLLDTIHRDGWWVKNISATSDPRHIALAFERTIDVS